jgi:hypothetical protein
MQEGKQPQYEYTLLQKQNIRMFKIPPMSNPAGHTFASWKENIWTGHVKVTAVGENCTVKFMNFDGTEYARAKIADNFKDSVQKVVDSSRGYAVRLTSEDGRSMWVGIGFHDRNDAFDFYVSFEDFQKKREMERNPHLFKPQQRKQLNLGLSPGQVINIGMGNDVQVTTSQPTQWDNYFDQKPTQAAGGFGFDLPPPKESSQQMTKGFDENNWGARMGGKKIDLLGDTTKPVAPSQPSMDWFSQAPPKQNIHPQQPQSQPPQPKDNFLDLLS